MSTPAQIVANRRNAQKSTGPRTTEGRNRTRLNALQHGITRQVTIMTDGERTGFMESCSEMVTDFAPAGAHERHLAQAIAEDHWRLDRSRATEQNIFTLGLADTLPDGSGNANSESAAEAEADLIVDDPRVHAAFTQARITVDHAHQLNLLSLYEQRISRSLHKNVALLRQLQAERKAEEQEALETALRLHERHVEAPRVRTAAFDPTRQINATESLVVSGFVFANNDLERESDRRHRFLHPRPTRRRPLPIPEKGGLKLAKRTHKRLNS